MSRQGPCGPATAFAGTAVVERYARGVDALRIWDAPTAREELEQAARLDPDNPLVHYALAEALAQLGHDRRSSEVAERAVEVAADLPRPIRLSLEARAATAADRWDEAIGLYRALHLFDPGNLEHGLGLARALRRGGRAEDALAVLDRFAAAAPGVDADPRIALQTSRALFDLGRFADSRHRAEESLRQAERREAPLLEAAGRVSLAWALFRLGDRKSAFGELTRAEATFRHHGDTGGAVAALGAQAAILQESGDLEQARDAYGAALALYREIGDRGREAATLNNLATVLATLGVAESLIHRRRFDPAERWLGRAFARLEGLDAPHAEATGHFVAGWLAEETGRPTEARRAYMQARDRWRGSSYDHKLAETEERLARLGGSGGSGGSDAGG